MTNRTKTIDGKIYYLISSGNNREIQHAFAIRYKNGKSEVSIGKSNSVRVVRFNDKEAVYESARYGVYVR